MGGQFARLAGVAPIPASSGKRVRLDRGGNCQLNCALHRIAVCQGRVPPPAREFLARKQAEGKSRREALRCPKLRLARRVWRLLIDSKIDQSLSNPSILREARRRRGLRQWLDIGATEHSRLGYRHPLNQRAPADAKQSRGSFCTYAVKKEPRVEDSGHLSEVAVPFAPIASERNHGSESCSPAGGDDGGLPPAGGEGLHRRQDPPVGALSSVK
jgi:hypothetical protein